MSAKNESYAELKANLDQILAELQDFDGDIDKAVELYKEGQQVITKLNKYLTSAKNSIEKIK